MLLCCHDLKIGKKMKRALYFDSLILAVGNLQKAACTAIRFRHILIFCTSH
ncbi:hypothetical protein HMPREF9098_0398 [Kingella denitrificans ATCC 33394]|uniref:Uncharacterized protein n=1 Tax=Kingella denitrificans ATCC 33394 TaxID=888741 RepID=F0EX18_9NEIS|nr:hypothetical protein HMPREF9098_0398 [Kingella denitrificans ATCC 33394]